MNSATSRWNKTLLAFGDPVVQFHKTTAADAMRSVAGVAAQSPVLTPSAYDTYMERGFSITRLPFTREEVLGIGRLFPLDQRRLYLGTSARASVVKHEDLNNYRYVHFATHALIDERVPERSGIILSPDSRSQEIGVLQSTDIMRLRMPISSLSLRAVQG